MKERTTSDCRNTPSTTNLEEEEIVDAPENDDNASMPEQIKRPNPWRKMIMMMMMMMMMATDYCFFAISLCSVKVLVSKPECRDFLNIMGPQI